jgi:hypothetical protein
MLTLGIPGSPTAAVLLGGLLIWGLQPGPLLFVEQKDFVWGLIASMYLGNIAGLIVVLTCVPFFAAILRVPFSIISPIIIVICAIGAYTVHGAMLDIWFMMLFGVVGYLFKKLNYPLAPLVLALVLGDRAEDSFRQSMLMSQGSPPVFLQLAGGGHWVRDRHAAWPVVPRALATVRRSLRDRSGACAAARLCAATLAVGHNGAVNANLYALLRDHFLERADQPCILIPDGQVIGYEDLDRTSARIASALRAADCRPGDRVAVQVDKCWEALALYLACLRAGFVYFPLNTGYQKNELTYFFGDAEPSVIVGRPGADDTLAALRPEATVFTLTSNQGTLLDAARDQDDC